MYRMINTKKRKTKTRPGEKKENYKEKRSHNATYCLCPPMSLSRPLDPLWSAATRGRAQRRWWPWEKERQSLAATHRSSRSSLVALVPSTDQTAHCTVLHWPSVFFCPRSVHKHWHTHSGGAGLRRSHEMSTHAWERVCTARPCFLVSLRIFAVIVVVVVLPYWVLKGWFLAHVPGTVRRLWTMDKGITLQVMGFPLDLDETVRAQV